MPPQHASASLEVARDEPRVCPAHTWMKDRQAGAGALWGILSQLWGALRLWAPSGVMRNLVLPPRHRYQAISRVHWRERSPGLHTG